MKAYETLVISETKSGTFDFTTYTENDIVDGELEQIGEAKYSLDYYKNNEIRGSFKNLTEEEWIELGEFIQELFKNIYDD